MHARTQTRNTQNHYARTTRHDTRLLSTTLRAHAPKQPTTPHSRATPAPTQAHQRCPRATARSSTVNLTRSAPSRHCPAGGKGAICQTHAAVAIHKARTRAPANPPTTAHTSTRTRIRAHRVSTTLVGAGYGAGTGGARSTGGQAHTKQRFGEPTWSREACAPMPSVSTGCLPVMRLARVPYTVYATPVRRTIFTYKTGFKHALPTLHLMCTRTRRVRTSYRGFQLNLIDPAGFRCGVMVERVRMRGRSGGGGHGGVED